MAGAEPANIQALTALLDIDDDFALVGPYVPAFLPDEWGILYASSITQMLRTSRTPLPDGDLEVVRLGAADFDEMLALVELTRPGPFRRRTIELGNYIGIREHGGVVAMAGERTWIGSFREVSAVCTHPEAQGRGYAKALIGRIVNRMLRAGETPYLHVESRNQRAIDLYLALGFARRLEFPLLNAKRIR